MSLSTFSTGLSGLEANSQGLNVVGNNLSNLNTIGFKASNISFVDVLSQAAGSGQGTAVSGVSRVFTQGTMISTNSPTDVAIQGRGFFVLSNGTDQMFSRAGNFHLDADRRLLNATGLAVQGYVRNPATGKIDTNQLARDLQIPATPGSPTPTAKFGIAANLDANAPTGTRFVTTVPVYDSLGKAHLATITFQKEISGGATPQTRWKFDVTVARKEFAGVAADNTEKLSLITGDVAVDPPAAGTMVFDSAGRLTSSFLGTEPQALPAAQNLRLPPANANIPALGNGGRLNTSGITWTLLNAAGEGNITGFSSASAVVSLSQDGMPTGTIDEIAINDDGVVVGILGGGLTVELAKISIATFANPEGLTPVGGNSFTQSASSGTPLIGTPGEGGRGSLASGRLEQSNVDIATEFTKIIAFQRGYQANARIITTTDQILQETLNLKT